MNDWGQPVDADLSVLWEPVTLAPSIEPVFAGLEPLMQRPDICVAGGSVVNAIHAECMTPACDVDVFVLSEAACEAVEQFLRKAAVRRLWLWGWSKFGPVYTALRPGNLPPWQFVFRLSSDGSGGAAEPALSVPDLFRSFDADYVQAALRVEPDTGQLLLGTTAGARAAWATGVTYMIGNQVTRPVRMCKALQKQFVVGVRAHPKFAALHTAYREARPSHGLERIGFDAQLGQVFQPALHRSDRGRVRSRYAGALLCDAGALDPRPYALDKLWVYLRPKAFEHEAIPIPMQPSEFDMAKQARSVVCARATPLWVSQLRIAAAAALRLGPGWDAYNGLHNALLREDPVVRDVYARRGFYGMLQRSIYNGRLQKTGVYKFVEEFVKSAGPARSTCMLERMANSVVIAHEEDMVQHRLHRLGKLEAYDVRLRLFACDDWAQVVELLCRESCTPCLLSDDEVAGLLRAFLQTKPEPPDMASAITALVEAGWCPKVVTYKDRLSPSATKALEAAFLMHSMWRNSERFLWAQTVAGAAEAAKLQTSGSVSNKMLQCILYENEQLFRYGDFSAEPCAAARLCEYAFLIGLFLK